jgi:hypothetical protein
VYDQGRGVFDAEGVQVQAKGFHGLGFDVILSEALAMGQGHDCSHLGLGYAAVLAVAVAIWLPFPLLPLPLWEGAGFWGLN